ncbi:MAG: YaiO family outer membrane beta-barrel protein [Bacteroidota bacterium]
MKINSYIITLAFLALLSFKSAAQQVNLDSLLYQSIDLLKEKEYQQVIENSKFALEKAPEYLDFNLILGRAYEMQNQPEKARENYKIIIDENPDYKDAFTYLVNLELKEENYEDALTAVNKAIAAHPEEINFYYKQLSIYNELDEHQQEYELIQFILENFDEENDDLNRRLRTLELRFNFNIAGISYSLTGFDRDGVGPWHLTGLQYIRQRKWGSLIGRVNYANRLSNGSTISDGVQYELESYFFTSNQSYAYVGGAYSNNRVFPTWRFGASYFQYLGSGWEVDLGARYNRVFDGKEFYTGALGVSKYFGNFWMYLRSFMQEHQSKYYPAFTLTNRYFINTRFDYFTFILGYGTSPDERATLGQFENRVATESYRATIGYFRMFNNTYLIGVQGGYNHQEFLPDRFQNEFELFLSFQYKF